MNQQMDFNAMIQGYFLGAAIRMTGMMMLDFIFMPQQREHLTATLGHEPTQEDWDDCCQFLGERALSPKYLQRAIDREKIRRLVFGENQDNPAYS